MTDESEKANAVAKLALCRDAIEQIDNQIVALLAKRLELGKQTGEIKQMAGLPILDPTREAAVIRRVASVAREAGLPTEPIREVFWLIVGMSRRVQERQ